MLLIICYTHSRIDSVCSCFIFSVPSPAQHAASRASWSGSTRASRPRKTRFVVCVLTRCIIVLCLCLVYVMCWYACRIIPTQQQTMPESVDGARNPTPTGSGPGGPSPLFCLPLSVQAAPRSVVFERIPSFR